MKAKKTGFTLVEMLIVIMVILILAGIVMKLVAVVGLRLAKSKAHYELQQLRNALNEYYAEYGSYPPVTSLKYEYESPTNQTYWFRQVFLPQHNDETSPEFFADNEDRMKVPGWHLHYQYGLVAYLWARDRGQKHWYDKDTERDANAKAKWLHFIDDVGPDGGGLTGYGTPPGLLSQAPYSNKVDTIIDPWGREYRYQCVPPYAHYKLWSAGQDGSDGTADDIYAEAIR